MVAAGGAAACPGAHQRRDGAEDGGARRGREVYVGLVTDEPFGPVIMFGAGGTMIELIADRAMELPPLNQFLARRLIERSRVAETLAEWRGASGRWRRSSRCCCASRRWSASCRSCARWTSTRSSSTNRRGGGRRAHRHRSMRRLERGRPLGPTTTTWPSCPTRRATSSVWPMRGGGQYTVRPIHPDDAQMLQALVRGLSAESRYFRFISSMAELPPAMLARFTLIDYDREMALVAVYKSSARPTLRA
jgi:acetyltransferase